MMGTDWNAAVLEQKYRISFADETDAPLVFPAEGLLRKETSMMFLRQVGEHIGSPGSIVTASLFFKRFLALICGGLHAMSHDSVGMNLALSNVAITGEKSWSIPRFVLRDQSVSRPEDGDRTKWREQVVRELFAGTAQPLIAALCAATSVKADILWAHASYLVHFYYQRWQDAAESAELKRQIADDFHYLTKAAGPSVFGLKKGRPFDTSYTMIPHPSDKGEPIQIRRQCCFQYRLEGGRCCYTCPHLNETQRVEQIRALGH
ncbi:IucA/IucC family C-terminal-domain containing protein [Brevibacillus borstelensis]|uniref:IucA/IucC family C-terminal-domain containing protein n=1 Tax=Brevibacillus borstelensis TaxID=45462 RepID=UPI0030C35F04